MIEPLGGTLVDRVAPVEQAAALLGRTCRLPRLRITRREASDIDLIACGALSPLEGFMGREDYCATLGEMRLARGVPWAIPITLGATAEQAAALGEGQEIALESPQGHVAAVMLVEDRFPWDKRAEALGVYGTEDERHPGVAHLARHPGTMLLGGPVTALSPARPAVFGEHERTPAGVRRACARRGWRRVVGFQTRNPIHRAHEYIIKCALEMSDGVLIHPLVGETIAEDIPADVRMRSYQALIDHYFPRDRVLLSVLPAAMRYAGPREAVHHAIMRRNYGCSHFIVGRDHAGVGSYYGTYDAQKIFERFDPVALGITPLCFENTFYCRRCFGMASSKTCSHPPAEHITLSGTEVRRLLRNGQVPPPEITRAEVAEVLVEALASPDYAI